jgi:hypothetical protein
MFVCCECCGLSGRGLCDGLITRQEEAYRMWRVVCVQKTSKNEEAKARYRAVKIQPQWVVTPGKQTNKDQYCSFETVITCSIWEVLSSDLSSETGCTNGDSSWLSSVLPGKCWQCTSDQITALSLAPSSIH